VPACLQFDAVLGRGAFKIVYKAFDTQEGQFRTPHAAAALPDGTSCLRFAAAFLPPLTDATWLVPHLTCGPICLHLPAGTEVAWNQVRVSELMSVKDAENKEERDRLFAEIRVLKALKHKNIMSFYDSWYDPRTYTVSFITELFTSGTLRQ
jgi:serine/threonine protein kinase